MTVDTSTEAVEKLLDGVTPGPWEAGDHGRVEAYRGLSYEDQADYWEKIADVETDADQRFITAARDLVPALIAERDTLKAEVERLKSHRAQSVKVKPLVWDVTGWQSGDGIKGENDDTWSASSHGFQYCCYCIDWHGGADFRLTDPDGYRTSHPSLAAAKAAAQSDYEARIMAALDAQPVTVQDAAKVPEVQAMIDAAKALHIDMLERAECRMDTIRGEQYRIVNSGRTAWANFDAALRAIAEGRE